jgi:transketolase
VRKQLVKTVGDTLKKDPDLVLLLGDIGVYGFKDSFTEFSNRVYNIGILEDATVSLAAGIAKTNLIPVIHTIAPFLVERCYEQLKIDFGYQALGGNFISVGASYDYASLGCTHHCPGDVGILQYIPGMEIYVPGSSEEFNSLFKTAYNNGKPSYFRLSEQENISSYLTEHGKASVIKHGKSLTVVVVGPVIDNVIFALEDIDASIIYYNSISPFDKTTLQKNISETGKILLVEPFYTGTISKLIYEALSEIDMPVSIKSIGVPNKFLTAYGKAEHHNKAIGLDRNNIHNVAKEFINVK